MEEKKKKKRFAINKMRLHYLQQELPKILVPFNLLRAIVSSVLQTNDLPEDPGDTYGQLLRFIKDGFPDSVKTSFAASAKGIDSYPKAAATIKEVQAMQQKHEGYMAFLRLDKEYYFAKDIEVLLDNMAGEWLTGKTAIDLGNDVQKFLSHYMDIYEKMENRVVGLHGGDLDIAIPLIKFDTDLTLKLNIPAIQALANKLEVDNSLVKYPVETARPPTVILPAGQ